jgi:hypothetical protein
MDITVLYNSYEKLHSSQKWKGINLKCQHDMCRILKQKNKRGEGGREKKNEKLEQALLSAPHSTI